LELGNLDDADEPGLDVVNARHSEPGPSHRASKSSQAKASHSQNPLMEKIIRLGQTLILVLGLNFNLTKFLLKDVLGWTLTWSQTWTQMDGIVIWTLIQDLTQKSQ
jgi:hypothetical protein